MDSQFFDRKRLWSRYKDAILEYYLHPYIPKVSQLRRQVRIVDCIAGRGRFGDGEPGSPVIISEAIRHWRNDGCQVVGEFIEADKSNFDVLAEVLVSSNEFATLKHGRFEEHVRDLADRAKTETLFLYLDPYTVKALVYDDLKAVYEEIQRSRASVEVLMNFNVATFMRWALAALKRIDPLPSDAIGEESDYQADDPEERVEIAILNSIAGGTYWRGIADDNTLSFAEKLDRFITEYTRLMQASFKYVCYYPVKSKYTHQTPKYMLIFGTRNADGLELMNEAMCKARLEFLESQFQSGTLFDMTPAAEVVDAPWLRKTLLEIVEDQGLIRRKDLRIQFLSSYFCKYNTKQINGAIADLLRSAKLESATGKTRINDETELRIPS
ncbi:three-Cys-motif partner protein TcmP [Aeoliella sp. SH292]|uniref:three-Cys-motif partner protein TcmP n=1 Tax=Aeoliella sp. SH292 TaxID=3454464 RepID=UPI003F9883ED